MTATPRVGHRLLFRNVRVFDGTSSTLVAGDVLIDDTTIAAVSESPVGDDPSRETTVIEGGNRVLMPGMSDAHVHLVGNANSYVDMVTGSEAHIALNGLAEAKKCCTAGSPRSGTWLVTQAASSQ